MRRHDSQTVAKRVAYLYLPTGRFVLLLDEKVYADLAEQIESPMSEDEEVTPERLLHAEGGTTTYQNLGKELVAGRNSNKYKTVVNSSSAGNVSHSETLIWIDETLNMPIKSETTSTDGTRITMELSNVTRDVDKSIFQVPNDYEKIAFTEFRKRLTPN
jgi:outer membrane lipoprotein-sorting protein